MSASASTDTFPADLNAPQPAPQPSPHPPVWDLVVRDMRARDLAGERKYKMRLRPFDGRATMVDAYQEVLDLAVYLRKHLYEAEHAPALPADVAETRRASGITIAPEAALHRALQERTDELERVRAELREARDEVSRLNEDQASAAATALRWLQERDEARAEVARWEAESREGYDLLAQITTPTAPDVGSTTSAPAAGAADPRRGRTPDEIRAWAAGLFGG